MTDTGYLDNVHGALWVNDAHLQYVPWSQQSRDPAMIALM